jgi:hypothetical protein
MSLRCEQRRALQATREFLRQLLVPGKRWTKTDLRRCAAGCLRHFPFLKANGEPLWSQDEDDQTL